MAPLFFMLEFLKKSYLVTRATDDGGEDGPGGVITGEAGLAHAGSVVHNQRCYFIVAHFVLLKLDELNHEKTKTRT